MHRPDPTLILAFIGVVWTVAGLAVVFYPLLSGRIRFGGPGSDPITRDGDPQSFWTAYVISTGLYALISAALGWVFFTKILVTL